jgi:predicted O-linked N-acetylglucosamine transferase (SPINDLY family)
LGAVDVLLDATIPQSSDWVCAALACAKPMVVWSRPGHSAPMLLKAAGAGACVANSRDEYTAIAVRLGNEESFRQHVIRNMTQSAPEVLARCDSFAMSDAFGRLLETAFDRVIQSRRVWRNEVSLLRLEEPLDVTAALEEAAMFMDIGSAADAEVRLRSLLQSGSKGDIVRRRLAAALTHQGQHAEAADLLISAVDLVPADASVWVELGQAARQAGRVQLAIQALQTAVKIDPKRVATWQTLAEIARDVGNEELLADINSILGQLEPPPTDASVPSLTADLADSAAR